MRKGRIWFTDPRYGADRSDLEMDVEGVYRIDPDGKVTRVLTQKEVERPNGIAVTPDGKTLYVIDSHPRPAATARSGRSTFQPDGTAGRQTAGLRLRQGPRRRRHAARRERQPVGGGRHQLTPRGNPARPPTCRRAST